MKHFYTKLLFLGLLTFLGTGLSFGQIISQYVETNSGTTPKGLEIWNNTGSDIVFSVSNNLQIFRGTNGGSCSALSGTNITSGTLTAGNVWIIGTSDIITYANANGTNLSGTTSFGFSFNGDDALQVRLGGTLIDMFGICGSDPGSAWSGSGVSTANQNITLLGSISTGNTSGFTDPSTRFSTVSTTPASTGGLAGFGNAPVPPSTAPTGVFTGTAGSITASSAITTGNDVTGDGGSAITERGVAYSTTSTPTIADNTVTDPGTTGNFDATISGLASSTQYFVRAYATNAVGTTYGNEINFTTNAPAGDSDSDIIENTGFTYPTDIDYSATVNSGPLNSGNSVEVAQFTIRDGAGFDADALSTTLTNLDLGISGHTNLDRVALFNGTTLIQEVAAASSVSFTGLFLSAADDSTQDFSVRVSFQSTVTDNAQLGFTITAATAQAGGSLFAAGDAGGASSSVSGDNNRIEVTASDLIFDQDVSDVQVSLVMSPSPSVQAVDGNVNLDLDFTGNVSLAITSGTTTFDASATTSVNAVGGIATFNNLIFDSVASGNVLTASATGLTDDSSSSFDVTALPIVVAQEDFDGTSPSWPNDISDQTFVDPSDATEGFFIQPSTNIGSGNTAYGDDMGGETGEPTLSPYTFTFEDVNVANFSNLELSFDYYAFANADSGSYEIFIDGVGQGPVEFYNDPDTTPVQGTITESIGTATTISLVLSGTLNGGGDIIELDNFKIEGSYVGDLVYSSGTWTPNTPPSSSSGSLDALIQDGAYSTSGDVSLNSISVLGDATVEISSTDVLTIGSSINNNGTFTFKSNSAGSAQLADATGATITGEVTVERYIPANRAYRLLSSPVTTSGTIFENWQENGIYPTSANGIGTHITGFQGTVGQFDASSGLDQTASGNPSMFTFDNVFVPTGAQTQFDGWDEVASTNQTGDNLIAETPYLLFVRGDRSIDLASNSSTPNNTTLSATGNIFTGLSTQTLSGQPQYFSLVANPFQAIVDFNALTFTGLGNPNFMYVYDPAQKDYVTLQTGTNDSDMFIRPGQSVFVVNSPGTATASTVQFEQTDINTSPSPGPGTTVFSDDFMAKLELELYNDSGELRENLRISFEDNASNAIDEFDAPKLTGGSEILASVNSGNIYTIERRAQVQSTDQVSILLDQYQGTDYEFRVKLENWNPDVEIFVADNYLGSTNQITPDQAYVFTVDSSIPESISENRFSLVFDNTTLGVDDNTFGSDFALYPNPTTDGQFSIKTTNLSGEVTIEMTNLLGQNVYSQDLVVIGSQVDVNAQNISTGIYVVKLTQGNQSFSTKLIVE